MAFAWMEILKPLDTLSKRLIDPERTQENLYALVLATMRDAIDRVPALNMADDAAMNNTAAAIRAALNGVTAEELAASPGQRIAVAQQTIGILTSFGEMGRRKFAA